MVDLRLNGLHQLLKPELQENSMDMRLGRGVNFGGWLSQAPDDEDHRRTFITKEDFNRVRDWGFDNVRLPFAGGDQEQAAPGAGVCEDRAR